MKLTLSVILAAVASPLCAHASRPYGHAQHLLQESMEWLDRFYDQSLGYLYDVSGSNAMRHNTRSTAWYALGLLARNQNDDIAQAEKIIANLASAQFKDSSFQWYGDYQKYPEEPAVGSLYYKAVPYKTWDPNVGLAFSGFGHWLTQKVARIRWHDLDSCIRGIWAPAQ